MFFYDIEAVKIFLLLVSWPATLKFSSTLIKGAKTLRKCNPWQWWEWVKCQNVNFWILNRLPIDLSVPSHTMLVNKSLFGGWPTDYVTSRRWSLQWSKKVNAPGEANKFFPIISRQLFLPKQLSPTIIGKHLQWYQKKLKANRLHPCNYLHTPTDDKQTDNKP